MRVHRVLLAVIVMLPLPLCGQGYILPPVSTVPIGAVSGRVFCGDTRLPARLASVTLTPVPKNDPEKKTGAASRNATTSAETYLDGSFTVPNVPPGDYYVTAQLAGFLSPILEFTAGDWSHPDEETRRRMDRAMIRVTVNSNATSQVEVMLAKGSVIAGTARFEDGLPISGAKVTLLRHDPKGKPSDYAAIDASGEIRTDDRGGYRFSGLPEGEYKVYVSLRINEPPPDPAWFQGRVVSVKEIIDASSQWSALDVYLDRAFRRADGKTVKVGSGETSNGNDIEIQVSRLHNVSGTVVDAATGSPVNVATVRIFWSGDAQTGGDTRLDTMAVGEDGSFHFGLVPEGTYSLKVTAAKSVLHQAATIPPPPLDSRGVMQAAQAEAPVDKTSREYDNASQPLIVQGDLAGVNIKLKVKSPNQSGN